MPLIIVLGIFTVVGIGLTYLFLHIKQTQFNLLTHLQEGALVVNEKYKIVSINPTLETYLGISAQDYVGKPYAHLSSQLIINESAIANTENPRFEIIQNNYILERTESPIKNSFGKQTGKVMFFRDMTQRSVAETNLGDRLEQLTLLRKVYDELSSTLNMPSVMMFALDSALRLSQAKAGYIALKDENDVLKPEGFLGAYDTDALRSSLENQHGIYGRVMRQRKAELIMNVDNDPDYEALIPNIRAMIIAPLLTRDNNIVGILCVETTNPERFGGHTFEFIQLLSNRIAAAVDNAILYEQVQLQLEELQHTYNKISNLEELKTEMIRIAAHDITNPVSAIILLIDMLDRLLPPDSHNMKDTIGRIRTSTNQIQRIVQDILSLEQIETLASDTGQMAQIIDMNRQMKLIMDEQLSLAEIKNIQLNIHIEESDTIFVNGDNTQMHEAMANLVQNAIKYTPNNGSVDVSLRIDNGYCVFAVKDTGYGIPEDMQERLFQPFYRAQTKETRNIEGTGLGLHLVKRIIERHRGEMIFQSVYTQGSQFGFRLPIVL